MTSSASLRLLPLAFLRSLWSRHVRAQLVEGLRRIMSFVLIYTTALATMPVHANEIEASSRALAPASRPAQMQEPSKSSVDPISTKQPRPAIDSSLLLASAAPAAKAKIRNVKKEAAQTQTQTAAPACLYALDSSAQGSFYLTGSTSISTS